MVRLNLAFGYKTKKILKERRVPGTDGVAVKCVDIVRNTKGEGRVLALS